MIIVRWRQGDERSDGAMDLKRMRRACADLAKDLDLPAPVDTDELISKLCRRMSERIGAPVRHELVRFPPNTITGCWLDTRDGHVLLCEADTSPWHQIVITGHEFWHMEAHHEAVSAGTDVGELVFPSLDPSTVTRILAARSYCHGPAEREAELFGSLLVATVSRWVPTTTGSAPGGAAAVVERMEATLGRGQERPPRG